MVTSVLFVPAVSLKLFLSIALKPELTISMIPINIRVVLIYACFFNFSVNAFSQKLAALKGVVIDFQTRLQIEGANVSIKGTAKGSITNKAGEFLITGLEPGQVTIVASFIGYGNVEKTHTIIEGDNVVDFDLLPESTELASVTVVGETDGQAEARRVINNVMPVTIITAKQIENRAGNLNEILARQAGVQIRLSGGLGSESRISVRGLEGKRVQIFLDGNPLNSPDGSLGINDLPVQIIERIEIYKGSVPAYLGGDGLGSAVNVVFRHREVSYIDASYSRQSFNTQLASLILKKTFDKQGIEAGIGVFDTRTDNDYTMLSPYQPGLKIKRNHDQYHSLLMGGSIRFHKWWFDEVEIEGAFVKNDRQIQGIQRNIQHVESRSKAGVAVISLIRKNLLSNRLGLRYNIILAKFDVKFIDTASYNYNWDGTRYPSMLGQGELGIGPNLSRNLQHDLRQRLNLDYRLNPKTTLNLNNTSRYATLDPNDPVGNRHAKKNVFNYPGSLKSSITGLTLEKRFLGARVLTSAAIKHYYNVVDGYNTNVYLTNATPDKLNTVTKEFGYNVGIRYNVTQLFLVKASHEKGVRLPNNSELFGDGVLITPSTALNPEIAHNYNAGLVYDRANSKGNRLQVEANGFFMDVDHLIQLSGNGLTLGYVNYARARIIGADFDFKCDVTQDIYASVNGTFQNLTDKNPFIPGTQDVKNPTYNLIIPNTPRLFFNWSLEFHKGNILGEHSRTRLIYDGAFGDKFNYGFNISVYDNFSIPSYLTHTISIVQSFEDGRYTVTAEANNLTDQVVINNFNQPLPGRTFRIKLRYLLFSKETTEHNH
jgi:outer membrane cobalamin receptor